MTRERNWMWTDYWCAACYVVIAVVCLHRKEEFWFLWFALANVVFFLILGERNRRAAKRAEEPAVNHAAAIAELEARNQAQAKMIGGYIALISAAKEAGMDFWWEGRTARADWSQEARAKAVRLNINDQVSVRFTEVGESIWIAFHEGKPPEMEMPDQLGWRRCQLWHLFEIFGPHIHMACDVPFVENEIRIAIPAIRPRWPQACHLCNKNMESESDRAEWHGLGNCVPVCMACMGSGIAEEKAESFTAKGAEGAKEVHYGLPSHCAECHMTDYQHSGTCSRNPRNKQRPATERNA